MENFVRYANFNIGRLHVGVRVLIIVCAQVLAIQTKVPLKYFESKVFDFLEKNNRKNDTIFVTFLHKSQKQIISLKSLLISHGSTHYTSMNILIGPFYEVLHEKWWVPKYVVKVRWLYLPNEKCNTP